MRRRKGVENRRISGTEILFKIGHVFALENASLEVMRRLNLLGRFLIRTGENKDC